MKNATAADHLLSFHYERYYSITKNNWRKQLLISERNYEGEILSVISDRNNIGLCFVNNYL